MRHLRGIRDSMSTVVAFFVTDHVSCRRANITQLIEKTLRRHSQLSNRYGQHDRLLTRGFPYLPANDYIIMNEPWQDELQQLDRDNRNLMVEYHDLCKTKVTKMDLMDDPVYDYQPSHYFEISCDGSLDDNQATTNGRPQQKCAFPGFHCVQRSRQFFLSRRLWDSPNCWEPHVIEIKSGCDCMWPAETLDDIRDHY